MEWTIQAGCKVNLFLEITGIRADGYHELDSIFYPLPSPFDTIVIAGSEKPGMTLECSDKSLDASSNIMTKAYDLFSQLTGFAPAIQVRLQKRIPMGAGLGGGSSDCAALLNWLNAAAGQMALPPVELTSLATRLGADVPFFLSFVPARVQGIGEIITPVPLDLSEYAMLLVCPDVHVNTRWAYARWDEVHAVATEGRKSLTVKKCEFKKPSFTKPPALWNCFEDVVFQDFPVLYEIKQELLRQGACASVMSGSGSSLFALFKSPEDLRRCVQRLGGSGLICHEIHAGGV